MSSSYWLLLDICAGLLVTDHNVLLLLAAFRYVHLIIGYYSQCILFIGCLHLPYYLSYILCRVNAAPLIIVLSVSFSSNKTFFVDEACCCIFPGSQPTVLDSGLKKMSFWTKFLYQCFDLYNYVLLLVNFNDLYITMLWVTGMLCRPITSCIIWIYVVPIYC